MSPAGRSELTVIVPLWNAEPWIAEAVQSVLDGADGLLELLVVDDASTDDGPRIAAAFGEPVRVIHQPRAGPAAARNRALAEARGALIGFLDADDRWTAGSPDPRRLLLDAQPQLDGVMGRTRAFVDGDATRVHAEPQHSLSLEGVLLRRTAVERHGRLDETRRYSEDVDWLLRLRDEGVRIARVDDVVAEFRLRAGSLTRDRAATDSGIVSALRASLERRGVVG